MWHVWEAYLVSADHFRQELLAQMGRATAHGAIDMLVNSGELYRSLGGYRGSTQGMPACCDAMQAEIKAGDTLLVEGTNGAGMTVRYLLPRGVPYERDALPFSLKPDPPGSSYECPVPRFSSFAAGSLFGRHSLERNFAVSETSFPRPPTSQLSSRWLSTRNPEFRPAA